MPRKPHIWVFFAEIGANKVALKLSLFRIYRRNFIFAATFGQNHTILSNLAVDLNKSVHSSGWKVHLEVIAKVASSCNKLTEQPHCLLDTRAIESRDVITLYLHSILCHIVCIWSYINAKTCIITQSVLNKTIVTTPPQESDGDLRHFHQFADTSCSTQNFHFAATFALKQLLAHKCSAHNQRKRKLPSTQSTSSPYDRVSLQHKHTIQPASQVTRKWILPHLCPFQWARVLRRHKSVQSGQARAFFACQSDFPTDPKRFSCPTKKLELFTHTYSSL